MTRLMSSFSSLKTGQPVASNLLIVDDDKDIVDSFAKIFAQNGFRVDAYTDPVVALASFKAGKCDVALLDIRMPKITGFELYRKMNALDPQVRFCFLTAFEILASEFETMFPDIKATKLLRKPIPISVLVKVVKELMPERPSTANLY